MKALLLLTLFAGAAPAPPPDAMTRPFLGEWKVDLVLVMSTCPDRDPLGVVTQREHWTLTASGWDLRVRVREAKTQSTSYAGLFAGSKGELVLDDEHRSSVHLAGDGKALEGELLQVQQGSGKAGAVTCAARYHLKASR